MIRSRSASILIAAAAVVSGGCASPFAEAPVPGERPRELAGRPADRSKAPPPPDSGVRVRGGGRAQETVAPSSDPENPPPRGDGRTPGGGNRAARPVVIGELEDPRSDHGLEGPPHADLVAVAVEQVGPTARVTVRVAGALPAPPPEGEVIGIGVDIYRGGSEESDYQVFADGSEDGWFAYLDTPRGIVRYPGRFYVTRARLVFEVPWSSLGDLRRGTFSSFVDWSRERVALNAVAQDHAPQNGGAPFARRVR